MLGPRIIDLRDLGETALLPPQGKNRRPSKPPRRGNPQPPAVLENFSNETLGLIESTGHACARGADYQSGALKKGLPQLFRRSRVSFDLAIRSCKVPGREQ